MEKRRRARINNCLNELKSLILDAMKKDVSSKNNVFQQRFDQKPSTSIDASPQVPKFNSQ